MSGYVKMIVIAALLLLALALWGKLRDKDARIAEAGAAATAAENPAEDTFDLAAFVAQVEAREMFLRLAMPGGAVLTMSATGFEGRVDLTRSSTASRRPVPPSQLRPARKRRCLAALGVMAPGLLDRNERGARGWEAILGLRLFSWARYDVGVLATLRTRNVTPSRLEILAPAFGVFVTR